MNPEAVFRHGSPTMADHTPGSAVTAGSVVVVGNTPRVAHSDIPANQLGALAVGGGVYVCIAGADADLGAGVKVFWDDTANRVTATAKSNLTFGFSVAAIAKGTSGLVFHQPDGEAAAS